MTHSEAVKGATSGTSVSLVTRDATGNWVVRFVCWLDATGTLVHAHPTNPCGYVTAPVSGRYELTANGY